MPLPCGFDIGPPVHDMGDRKGETDRAAQLRTKGFAPIGAIGIATLGRLAIGIGGIVRHRQLRFRYRGAVAASRLLYPARADATVPMGERA